MQDRQREAGAPEAFEWVEETTPGLVPVLRAAGLVVQEHPLMVLEQPLDVVPPDGVELLPLAADDAEDLLAGATSAVGAGFGDTDDLGRARTHRPPPGPVAHRVGATGRRLRRDRSRRRGLPRTARRRHRADRHRRAAAGTEPGHRGGDHRGLGDGRRRARRRGRCSCRQARRGWPTSTPGWASSGSARPAWPSGRLSRRALRGPRSWWDRDDVRRSVPARRRR